MNNRRDFLKLTGLAGITLAGGGIPQGFSSSLEMTGESIPVLTPSNSNLMTTIGEENLSIIGQYGQWAASFTEGKLPALSFRNKEFTNLESWKEAAKKKLTERLAIPDIGGTPTVTVKKQYTYDGLHIEELTWQLTLWSSHRRNPSQAVKCNKDHSPEFLHFMITPETNILEPEKSQGHLTVNIP